jgi:hypothetical protein
MIIFSKTWNLGWKKKIQNFQKHKIEKIRELPNTGPYSRYKALKIIFLVKFRQNSKLKT